MHFLKNTFCSSSCYSNGESENDGDTVLQKVLGNYFLRGTASNTFKLFHFFHFCSFLKKVKNRKIFCAKIIFRKSKSAWENGGAVLVRLKWREKSKNGESEIQKYFQKINFFQKKFYFFQKNQKMHFVQKVRRCFGTKSAQLVAISKGDGKNACFCKKCKKCIFLKKLKIIFVKLFFRNRRRRT